VKAPADYRLIGRWRIVEAGIRDRAYLNLSGPATLTITAQGGEIAFGTLEAGLQRFQMCKVVRYAPAASGHPSESAQAFLTRRLLPDSAARCGGRLRNAGWT
jgi:hypothetical protein